MSEQRLFSNRQLTQLIVPLIVEQGLSMLVSLCAGVMVSPVGEAAISAVSLVNLINAVVMVLFTSLASGGAVVTSQFLGSRDLEKAKKSAGQLVLMAAVLGSALAVVCVTLAQTLMKLFFGAIEQAVMDAGLIYFRITAASFPFLALYNAGAAIFRSMGNSKISMKVSLLMNVVNLTGNALLIYGLGFGVAGVAIPTLLSRAVAAVSILYLAAKPGQVLSLERRSVFHVEKDMMGNILRIGIPSACENSFFQLGRLVVASMITLFGTTHTSANAVGCSIDGIGCIAGNAMGFAIVTVVGQCVGAKDLKQVKHYTKKMMGLSYLIQGIVHVLIFIFAEQLVSMYSSLSAETFALTVRLVRINAFFAIFFWPGAFVLPNALRATNDVRFTMWVGIGSMGIFRIIGSWIFCVYMELGVLGVWYAMVIDWVYRVSFFLWRLLSGKWKAKCGLDQVPV